MASSRENAGRQLYSGNSNQGSITSPVNIAPSLFHNKTPSKQRFNLYHFLYIFENCSNVLFRLRIRQYSPLQVRSYNVSSLPVITKKTHLRVALLI